jgi:hypothetical protein
MASPVVSLISPSSGSSSGGDTVTVTGSGFTGATAVDFGPVPSASFAVWSDTNLVALSPAGSGTVDITVTTPSGTSLVSTADEYIYEVASAYTPKYTTLAALEAYMRAQVPPGQSETTDSAAILSSIAQAEEAMDCEYASHLEFRTNVFETAEIAFVDMQGWLHMQLLHPVIDVSAVQIMDRDGGDTTWQTLTLANVFPGRSPTLYPNDPPNLRSYQCDVYSSSPILSACSTGGLIAQVSYTSGYASIPPAVTAVTNRFAYWVYQLREMPMGKVADLTNHSITVPLDMPKDVRSVLRSWRRENF